jgi:hypothetical protein
VSYDDYDYDYDDYDYDDYDDYDYDYDDYDDYDYDDDCYDYNIDPPNLRFWMKCGARHQIEDHNGPFSYTLTAFGKHLGNI